MHANICWQSTACIVCKEINLWLRYGWCGLEDGLLLLLVLDVELLLLAGELWFAPSLPFSS
jgi:hypothetical protein